jgi:hypothetical protein
LQKVSEKAAMIESMDEADELKKEGLDKPIDTIIFFKNFIDTSTMLSPADKKLLGAGKMRMQMNVAEKRFLIDLNFPFDTAGELERLMSGVGAKNIGNAMKSVFGRTAPSKQLLDAPQELEIEQLWQAYDVKVEPKKISKSLNKERYNIIMARSEMAEMQQLAEGGIKLMMTSVIKFPRPVKYLNNSLMRLSEDKRTVAFRFNLLDAMNKPDKYGFVVEY